MKIDSLEMELIKAVNESIVEAMCPDSKPKKPHIFYIETSNERVIFYTKAGAIINFDKMPAYCGDC